MFFFISLALYSSSIALAAEAPRAVFNSEEKAAAESFVAAASDIRRNKYGNVHFKITGSRSAQTAKGTMQTDTEYEYWAREGKYFRLDSRVTKSADRKLNGMRRRIVVTPDTSIRMQSSSPNGALTVRDWTAAEDGVGFIRGNYFVDAAVRAGPISYADEIVKTLTSREPTMNNGNLQLNGVAFSTADSRLKISWTWTDGQHSSVSDLTCDPSKGIVFDSKSISYENGKEVVSRKSTRDYKLDAFDCIPSLQQVETAFSSNSTAAQSSNIRETFRTTAVDWQPVPLGIFSLEAQGVHIATSSGIWLRRLVIFCIGVGLFALALFIKRRRQAAYA
jgi:hypothetical protein